MSTIHTVPVYFGWDAYDVVERHLCKRGKTHAGCVVVDETGVAVDYGGRTRHHNRQDLGDLAPSFQFQAPKARVDLDRLAIVGWAEADTPLGP